MPSTDHEEQLYPSYPHIPILGRAGCILVSPDRVCPCAGRKAVRRRTRQAHEEQRGGDRKT